MRKLYLSIILLLFTAPSLQAQSYSLAASSGTFTALTGGTAVTLVDADGSGLPNDEGYANAIPIGFSFTYNGTSYTTLNVNSNGFLTFGTAFATSASNNFWSNNLTSGPSSQTNVRPIVAPLWDDHEVTGGISYAVSGVAPNRVFTIEWLNVKWRYNATAASISFQVKLYETSNNIAFVYRQEAGAVGASPSASIGLTAAGTGADNFISLNGSSASPTTSTTTETTTITTRPATGQIYTFTPVALPANDISVSALNTLGKLPLAYSANHVVTAVIKNGSATTKTNIQVTLNITGANTFTNTQTIASLASGATTTVSFAAFTPTSLGNNTVTVSVPADDNAANNSKTFNQEVTYRSLSYADNSAATNSVGYNTGSGLIVNKHTITGTGYVRNVGVFIGGGTGNTVYGVVLDAAGAIIGQSANYVLQASDVGNWVNFVIPTPPAVTNQDFYVGLAQTANATTGYFPVGTQTESPTKTTAYYTAPLAGGTTTAQTTLGRFMISAGIETTLPVSLIDFRGEHKGNANQLLWSTATESNNKGFEIERSADGKKFSAIGFTNTKAEAGNSSTTLSYSFLDEKALAGTNYYRLKQLDRDGKFTYSSIVALKSDKGGIVISSAYPNPAKDQVNVVISSSASEKATITVTDMNGKTLKQLNTALSAGDNNISINVAELATGSYYIRLVSGNTISTTQFIKN